MKNSAKILLGLGAAALLSTTAFVGTAWSEGDKDQSVRGHDRMHAMHARSGRDFRRGHGRFGESFLELYDGDKDGKVTQAEIDKTRADRLAQFDADKDGTLTLQEYQALWLDAMRERMVDAFQAHDDDGDGKVTVAEFQKRYRNFVERLDRNDDGAYSRDDTRRHRGEHGRDL